MVCCQVCYFSRNIICLQKALILGAYVCMIGKIYFINIYVNCMVNQLSQNRFKSSLLKLCVSCALALGVAGCAQIQFVTQSAKSLGGIVGTNNYGEYGPRYKLGLPYSIKGQRYIPEENYNYQETGVASWYGPNFHGKTTANGGTFDMHTISAAHRTLPLPSVVRVTNLENGRQLKILINDRGPYAHDRIIDLSRRSAELLGMRRKGTALVRVEIIADESRALKDYMKSKGKYGRLPSPSMSSRYTDLRDKKIQPQVGAAPVSKVSIGKISSSQSIASQSAIPKVSTAKVSTAKVSPISTQKSTPILKKPNHGVQSTTPMANPRPVTPIRQGTFIQAGVFSDKDNAIKTVRMLKKYGIARLDAITNSAGKRYYRVRVGPIKTSENADSILQSIRNSGFKDASAIFVKQ